MNSPWHDVLRSAKWLPAQSDNSVCFSPHGNLLVSLASDWRTTCSPDHGHDGGPRASKFQSWLEQQIAAGAWLSLELPPLSNAPDQTVSEYRLAWWPRGIPCGRRIAIVSSRVGRRLDQRPEWLAAFRSTCAKAEAEQAILLTGSGTTTARLVERAAKRFDLRALIVHEPQSGETGTRWLNRMFRYAAATPNDNLYQVYLSPALPFGEEPPSSASENLPLCDRAVVAWADQLFISYLRPGGNLETLVRQRLMHSQCAEANHERPSVFVALGPQLVPSPLAEQLLNLGAIGWILLPPDRSENDPLVVRNDPVPSYFPVPAAISWETVPRIPWSGAESYLTHCTRGPAGPWPEQTEQEFLDELLDPHPPAERSALNALVRIIEMQRILGSAAGLRGGTAAVCFTAVPLTALRSLRIYQPQRKCWNFEPYGICIRRDWLVANGTREVIYGDEETWHTLPEVDRPFFQRRGTRRGNRPRDWTREREWRHLGDVDLSGVPRSAAVVFVAALHEVELIARVSRWPVTLCP